MPILSLNVTSITGTEHMSILKRPTEGGSGGKLGHSNMEHWEYTEEIKKATKVRRRNNDKEEIRQAVDEFEKNKNKNPKS